MFHYHLVTSRVREVEARYIGKLGFILVFLIIMWAANSIGGHLFAILMTVLTAFYILSRGIVKASRVLEQ